MNIYLQELRSNRKITAIWTVSLSLLMFVYFSMFTSVAKDGDAFIKLMEGYPEEFRNAFGMKIESLTSLLGFYAFSLTIITLFSAIQAMNLGISIISKEVREKTADFLLTKPVSRIRILSEKILAGLTLLGITNLIFLTLALVMANLVKDTDFSVIKFILMTLSLLFVQLVFYALGVFFSVTILKIKSALTISLGTVFAFFAIAAFAVTANDHKLRYLTPFKYFDLYEVIDHGFYEIKFILTAIILITVFMGSSFILLKNKDIHAV